MKGPPSWRRPVDLDPHPLREPSRSRKPKPSGHLVHLQPSKAFKGMASHLQLVQPRARRLPRPPRTPWLEDQPWNPRQHLEDQPQPPQEPRTPSRPCLTRRNSWHPSSSRARALVPPLLLKSEERLDTRNRTRLEHFPAFLAAAKGSWPTPAASAFEMAADRVAASPPARAASSSASA